MISQQAEEYNMSESTTKQFAPMMWKDPSEKAPSFCKGEINIKITDFADWLRDTASEYQSEKGWIRIDLKESRKGGLYFELNTFKPQKKAEQKSEPAIDPETNINTEDIPFKSNLSKL